MIVPTVPVIALPEEEQTGGRNLNIHLINLDGYRSRFRSALALFDEAQQRMQIEESRRDLILDSMSHTISSCHPNEIENFKPLFRARADLIRESQDAIMVPCDWRSMAARDVALTIYHFGKTFEAIRDTIACCPRLLALVGDISPGILSSRIPDYQAVRHAVAHEAENLNTNLLSGRHGIDGPHVRPGLNREAGARNVFISGLLQGHTYTVTVAGKKTPASVCSIEISVDTLSSLGAVCADVFSKFAQASEILRINYLAKRSALAECNSSKPPEPPQQD